MRPVHLLVLLLTACEGGVDAPRECQPQALTQPVPTTEADPAARIYWDNSASMKRFFRNSGPYARLGSSMESAVLSGARVRRWKHEYVADASEVADGFHPPDFSGKWSNLLAVGEALGRLSASAEAVHVLVSDLEVDAPPALRNVPDAKVCDDVSLPNDQGPASYQFGFCLEKGLLAAPPSSLLATVLRAQSGTDALYVLVVARDPEAGRRVADGVRGVLEDVTELVLADTSGYSGTADLGPCSASAESPRPLFPPGGSASACRYYVGSNGSVSHTLRCGVTRKGPVGEALLKVNATSIRADGMPTALPDTGPVGLTLTATARTDTELRVLNSIVQVADARKQIEAFVHPRADEGDASELTPAEKGVSNVIEGIVSALERLPPPQGPAWSVRYE